MINSFLLLITVLVSLQCVLEANAQSNINELNSNLQTNAVPPPRRRQLRNTLHIDIAPPSIVEMVPGTRLVLKCKVLGRPLPSVQWLKNGDPVSTSHEEQSTNIIPAHPSSAGFLISNLVVLSAETGDVFTCVATSGVKEDSASTTVFTVDGDEQNNLLTLQKLYRLPSKPIITTYYVNVFQNIGTTLVLPCRVHSLSESQVFWLSNDKNIYENSRLQVLPSGDLLITNLLWSDMGNFTCIAKNIYGKDSIETFVYPLKPNGLHTYIGPDKLTRR